MTPMHFQAFSALLSYPEQDLLDALGEIRAALAPFGLTHVQFVLLAALTAMDRETAVTQRDLAERAVTDPMMTSQVLRALEDKDLVERHPHPTDRRARTLKVTPAGVALANRANAARTVAMWCSS